MHSNMWSAIKCFLNLSMKLQVNFEVGTFCLPAFSNIFYKVNSVINELCQNWQLEIKLLIKILKCLGLKGRITFWGMLRSLVKANWITIRCHNLFTVARNLTPPISATVSGIYDYGVLSLKFEWLFARCPLEGQAELFDQRLR